MSSVPSVHFGAEEDGGGDDGNDDDLDGLEDVHKGVLLDEEPLLVEASAEELHLRDGVPGEDEGGAVAARSVKGEGELVVQPHPHVEPFEPGGELLDGDVPVGPAPVRPVLLLVLPRRHLPP